MSKYIFYECGNEPVVLDYLNAKNHICSTHAGCTSCPICQYMEAHKILDDIGDSSRCRRFERQYPEEFINLVERWAKEKDGMNSIDKIMTEEIERMSSRLKHNCLAYEAIPIVDGIGFNKITDDGLIIKVRVRKNETECWKPLKPKLTR